MQAFILNCCNVCRKILENAQHSSIREMLCFPMITQDYIQQESHRKNYWIYVGLFYPIHDIH